MSIKNKNNLFPVFITILVLVSLGGATWLTPKIVDTWNNLFSANTNSENNYRLDAPSEVLPLALKPVETRKSNLEAIANKKEKSLDRSRARYLLAVDLLKEYKGGEALGYLDDLEKDYTILAPYVLLRRGRAYELTNEKDKAIKIWEKLIEKYPDSLVVADALYKLGTYEPSYWQKAIATYPQHPRTHDIAYKLLEENPKQKDLLLLLAKYDKSYKSNPIRDRLIKEYVTELTPENWQTIGDGYWNKGLYKKASEAYKSAVKTPQNIYRLARSYQIIDDKIAAKTTYQDLISKFPDSPETATGLRRLATLSQGDEALSYLNQTINKFPEEAPEALVQKASVLTKLGRYNEAKQTRESLIDKYPTSDEAASYRWQIAKTYANSGNFLSAWQWAQQIIANNPDSTITPKAGFWIGKWAKKLDQNDQSQEAFNYVINNYPQSYYAWRSAVNAGWDVPDFTNLRQQTPEVIELTNRFLPPGGSTMFKELFLLAEDRDAIDLFTAETSNQSELTVAQQFTEGLLQQIQGNNLKGINLIWSLKKKGNPKALTEWQILRKSPEYWYALFPFPYESLILKWSKERELNPLLVTSLIRQESRFEAKIKSPVGATGLMQVMPATGKEVASQVGLKEYSLTNPNDNINLGTKYLDFTHKTYNNNSLFAIASYNAGPGNVSSWIKKYSTKDLDEFVENIPFRETKGYVETVFGNYWNYLRIYNPEMSKKVGIK